MIYVSFLGMLCSFKFSYDLNSFLLFVNVVFNSETLSLTLNTICNKCLFLTMIISCNVQFSLLFLKVHLLHILIYKINLDFVLLYSSIYLLLVVLLVVLSLSL